MSTFNETFFDFDAEEERLDEDIAALERKLQALRDRDGDVDDKVAALQAQKSQLQSQRKGVIWARDTAPDHEDFPMWDEAVDGVTLGAVRASTFGNLENDLESDPNAGSGTSNILLVADGTVKAPYADDSMSDAQLTGAVGQLHPYYIKWASSAVDRLLDPSGNATSSVTSPAETSASKK